MQLGGPIARSIVSAGVSAVVLLVVAASTGPMRARDAGDGAPAPNTAESDSVSAQEGLYQVDYNGHFTFTRIRYGGGGFGWGNSSAWNHDYPAADLNMEMLLNEFTFLRSNAGGSNVLDLEDPRIFQYPVLYMSEPGYWTASGEGIRNLRSYLLKGGYLIFDDFEDTQWNNMAAEMKRALPEYEWFSLDESHPVFRMFYFVQDIYVPHPLVAVRPNYQALFEDNDPKKRILVLANHNSDLGEYWEWAARGAFGMAPTNDAYRMGINYILYGLIH